MPSGESDNTLGILTQIWDSIRQTFSISTSYLVYTSSAVRISAFSIIDWDMISLSKGSRWWWGRWAVWRTWECSIERGVIPSRTNLFGINWSGGSGKGSAPIAYLIAISQLEAAEKRMVFEEFFKIRRLSEDSFSGETIHQSQQCVSRRIFTLRTRW